jgi:hypothetical protein
MDIQTDPSAALTQPATPTPDPTGGAQGAGGAGAAIADAARQIASEPAPASTPAATPAPQATPIHPVRRGGLAGIVDEMRDAIAGTTTSHIATDADGNKYVNVAPLSHKQQWMRVAAELGEGAAAGLAAGKGAGNSGRAAQAGFGVGHHEAEARDQHRQAEDQEVNQDQLNKYNMVMLKHQIAGSDFALTRMGVRANEEDVKFAQEQADREHTLGSADLGVFHDPGDFARIAQKNPQFWKDFYSEPGRFVAVPEIGADGQRKGIHMFMRTQGVGDQLVPKGTKVLDFVPGEKPEDPPKLTERTLSGPATYNQVDAANGAAWKKHQDWQKTNQETEDKNSQKNLRDEQTKEAHEGIAEKKAQTAKALAEAAKARSETVTPNSGVDWHADPTRSDIAMGLADGRYLMGRDLPLRTARDQITAAEHTRNANQYSMERYGIPYSPEIIRQEARLAEDPKTQAYLTGIDRMIGTPGIGGQLDQVIDLAKRAGLGDTAPVNQVKLWVKETMGSEAAKNFESALSDTQKSLTTLIGNPMLGSSDSDMKLKEAKRQFGSNPTLGNLKSTVATTKEILERSRAEFARNNRYVQKRYGTQYSPAQQPQAKPKTPDGATSEVYTPDGKTLTGWMTPRGYVAVQ